MIRIFKYALVIGVLAGFYSCATDVNVRGNYPPTAVVYGNLDAGVTTHVIRINRTFLGGDGSAFDYAKVPDSTTAEGIKPIIEKINQSKVLKTYPLYDTVVNGAPDGVFYSGANKAWAFQEPNLITTTDNDSLRYRLSFDFSGKHVSATTAIVGKPKQTDPTSRNFIDIFSDNNISNITGKSYKPYVAGLLLGENSGSVEFIVSFTYLEEYLDGTSAEKSLELSRQAGVFSSNNKNAGYSFEGSGLLNVIMNSIEVNPNVKQRKIENLTLKSSVAAPELTTYIEVNNPISGVLQERPEYTNVNNGVGIFSSETSLFTGIPVGVNTSRYIIEIKPELKFCSTNQQFSGAEGNLLCK